INGNTSLRYLEFREGAFDFQTLQQNLLKYTKLSFLILGVIIIVSFTISKIIQVIFTKSKLKRRI
ncbi:hypothetical protein DVW75_14445, partial [Enterococcus faecalis]